MSEIWRQYRRDRLAMVGLVSLMGFVALAILAPWLSSEAGLRAVNSIGNPTWHSPTLSFPLGTDNLGRSVAAQFVWGSRVSLIVGLMATFLTILIGASIGLVAGFFGGWVESILMRLTDWFFVIPFLPLAIVLASILSRGLFTIIVVIGVTTWPTTARVVRSQTITVKERLFVERSESLGASRWHQLRHHVLPNVAPLIVATTTLTVPISILTETTLSFLGLGDPGRASWGRTLNEAYASGALGREAWWYYGPAGLGIVAVVLAFTLCGRALEEIVDPRLRRR